MSDPAHKETDRLLKEMEKKIAKVYRQAEQEVSEKLADYMRRFDTKDKIWQGWVKTGKKTDKQYKEWLTGQVMISKRWKEMRESLAEDYHNANKIAKSVVNGYMPEVYALNRNYSTYEIEHGLGIDTSYTAYDRQTIERIFRENPKLYHGPGEKRQRDIDEKKDIKWNENKIQSAMLQSILQGESIPNITTRLMEAVGEVGESNRKAMVRNARTMTTGVENAGRVEGYRRAEKMGIKVKKQWLATLDGRTRHSHRLLDGEIMDVDKKFSNGCMFPGDPDGAPSEIYNCRCTLIGYLEGFERDLSDLNIRHVKDIEGMSYKEWQESKKITSNPILLPEEKSAAIKGAYIAEYRGFPDKGVEKEQAEYKTTHFDDIEQALDNAYEYHRKENGMSSVPLDELGSLKSHVLNVDYGGMSRESAKCFSDTISTLIEKYDTPLQKVRVMGKQEAAFAKEFAATGHNYSVDSAEIVINPVKCGNYKKLVERIRELSDNGYAVKIDNGKEDQYVATHEFAHSILNVTDKLSDKTNYVNANYGKIKEARKEIQGLYNNYMGEVKSLSQKIEAAEKRYEAAFDSMASREELQSAIDNLNALDKEMQELRISDYSLINVNEFLAEAFTQAEIGTPGKYGMAVIEVIRRYFGR